VTAAAIAAKLGNARREGHDWRCICPLHGGRSLTLRDGRERLLVKCWTGCDTRDVLAELRRMGLIVGRSDGDRRTPVTAPREEDGDDTTRRCDIARRIWREARNARGTPVECYLMARGIGLPVTAPLRYVPALRRPDGTRAPAMVARVDGLDGEPVAVHRTWLARGEDGVWRRRDRASLGPIAGGAVRLAPAAETVLVGEGIETTLAGMVATELPGWTAISTSGLVALRLPPEVCGVILLADHDRNGAGQRAAHAAAQRLLAQGRRVRIALPPQTGWDFADLLNAGPRLVGGRDVAV
jgi:putative DNA primase/helicase